MALRAHPSRPWSRSCPKPPSTQGRNGPLASRAAGPRPSPGAAAWLASDAACFSKPVSEPPHEARGSWDNAILWLLPQMSHSHCKETVPLADGRADRDHLGVWPSSSIKQAGRMERGEEEEEGEEAGTQSRAGVGRS